MKMVAKTAAYDFIRQKLMYGKLKPGDAVSELGISKEMGISRSPIREAICQLQSEGFIRKMEGYGAFVPVLSVKEVRELFEVRAALECLAAEQAAVKITPDQIETLMECCRELRQQAVDARDRKLKTFDEVLLRRNFLADAKLHATIIEASGNALIRRVVGDLHIMSRTFVTKLEMEFKPPSDLPWDYLKHYRLIRPFRNHDPQAAGEQMREHILGSLPEVLADHQKWLDGLANSRSLDYSVDIGDQIRRMSEI